MGPRPAAFVRAFDPAREQRRRSRRWCTAGSAAATCVALLLILQRMLREYGSIEGFFARRRRSGGARRPRGAGFVLARARSRPTCRRPTGRRLPARAGVGYFFPRPSGGQRVQAAQPVSALDGAASDAIDLGVWTTLSPSRLVVPLDTHVIRLGRCLRLTRYTSPGWKMAAEITAALRAIDAADPVRYDFSLCHVGMMNACGFDRAQRDAQCPLRGVCQPRVRKPRSSPRPSARR